MRKFAKAVLQSRQLVLSAFPKDSSAYVLARSAASVNRSSSVSASHCLRFMFEIARTHEGIVAAYYRIDFSLVAQLCVASIAIFGSQNQESRYRTDIPQTSVSSAYTTQPWLNPLRTCWLFTNLHLCPTAKAYLGQSRSARVSLSCPIATL